MSPDSIIPDGNPQSLNRYSYVNNEPINHKDPDGHKKTCGWNDDDNPECYRNDTNFVTIPMQVAHNRQYQDDCAAGRNPACPGGTVGMILTGAAMIATAGVADYVIASGAGADALIQAAWKAAEACSASSICWGITGAGGAATDGLIKTSNATTNQVVPDLRPDKLAHIFNPKHNFGPLLKTFDNDQSSAFIGLYQQFSNVAHNYSNDELNSGITLVVNEIEVVIRGSIVDGIARISDAFVK